MYVIQNEQHAKRIVEEVRKKEKFKKLLRKLYL